MSQNTHLKHISVKGFKSIEQLDMNMEAVNILIGANGAGKTNFISLFTFLRQLSEGKLQNYVEKLGFANTFFHFGSKKTKNITIELDMGEFGYNADFEHSVAQDSLIFKKEYCTKKGISKSYTIKGAKGESGLLPFSDVDSVAVRKYTRDYLKACRVYHFHDTSNTAGFKQATPLDASDFLYSDASNIAAFLYLLKNSNNLEYSKSYQEIVRAVKTVTPFFHDFYLEARGDENNPKILLKWSHRDHDDPFSANQLSDGTARFICMATLFLQPESLRPNTIILDEPELGLHPAALDVLADLVKDASKTNQVICSTQSVSFANNFEPEDFIVVDQEKGASVFKRLESAPLAHWLEDYRMGDIWSKNLVGGRPEW